MEAPALLRFKTHLGTECYRSLLEGPRLYPPPQPFFLPLFTPRPRKGVLTVANGDGGRELAEKVRKVICQQWEGAGGSLESAVVYQRLLEEGVDVPNYQMSAILNAFRVGRLITVLLRPQREEEVRKHGDLLISGVSPDLCNSS
jgi:hypothetical protein